MSSGLGDPATGDASSDQPISGAELQRRAIGGSLWTVLHSVTGVPIAFVANAIAARILGPSDYGDLAFLTLALSIAVNVTNFGFDHAILQWGTAAESRGDRSAADLFLRKSMGFRTLVQLPLLLATALYLARDESVWVNVALLVTVTVPALFGSAALAVTIENRTGASARLAMVANLIIQLSIVASAIVTESSAGVWAARSVTASLLLPLNFLLLDRVRRHAARSLALPRQLPAGFWRYAWGTGIAVLLGTLVFSRVEVFYLRWWSDAASVGEYALAYGLAYQITAPVDALLGPLLPAIAGIFSTAPEKLHEALNRSLRFAALLSGAVLGVLVPALYFVVPQIYGPDFDAVRRLLLPLAVISCVQSCLNPVLAFVFGRRTSGVLVTAYSWGLAVGTAIAAATVPPLAAWGAVLANIAAQAVVLWRITRSEATAQAISGWHILRQIRALAVGGLALGATVSLLSPTLGSGWIAGVAATALGLITFLVGTRVSRSGLTARDWEVLAGAVPRARGLVSRASRLIGVVG